MNVVNEHIKKKNGTLNSHADIFLHNLQNSGEAERNKTDEVVTGLRIKFVVVDDLKDFISLLQELQNEPKRTCRCGDCNAWTETKRMCSGLVLGDCGESGELKRDINECEFGKFRQK